MVRLPELVLGSTGAYVLSCSMLRPFLIYILLTACLIVPAQAQQRIDKKNLKAQSEQPGGKFTTHSGKTDSISIGSIDINRWERFTNKFGVRNSFGLFATLPPLERPYRILSWNLPFYGGSLSSAGLIEAGIGADIWIGASTLSDIHPDSVDASAASASVKAEAFQYAEVTFNFSGLSAIDKTVTIALEAYYASGPDSGAVSPIWTTDQRINSYFYSRPEAVTDSTTEVVLYEHDAFWALYGVDPSVFGEISGYLLVEIDTTSTNPADGNGGPLSTSLREKWYLPGSHAVVSSYPNPFNPSTMVRIMPQHTGIHDIVVYDLLGRVVSKHRMHAYAGREAQWNWDASGLASGVYLVSVLHGGERWHHAVTLSK